MNKKDDLLYPKLIQNGRPSTHGEDFLYQVLDEIREVQEDREFAALIIWLEELMSTELAHRGKKFRLTNDELYPFGKT